MKSNDRITAASGKRSPLSKAVSENNAKMVAELLSQFEDPNIKDKLGLTPLHVAIKNGNPDIVGLLLAENADVTLTDNQGKNPVDYAIQNKDYKCLKALLQYAKNHYSEDNVEMISKIFKSINLNDIKQLRKMISLEEWIELINRIPVQNKGADLIGVLEFATHAADEKKLDISWVEGWNEKDANIALKNVIDLYQRSQNLSTIEKDQLEGLRSIVLDLANFSTRNLFENPQILIEKEKTLLEKWDKTNNPKEVYLSYGEISHSEYVRIYQNQKTGKFHFTIYNAGYESEVTSAERSLTKGIQEFELNLDSIKLSEDKIKEISKHPNKEHLIEEEKIKKFIQYVMETKQGAKNYKSEINQCCTDGKEMRYIQERAQARGNCSFYSLSMLMRDRLDSSLFKKFQTFYSDPNELLTTIFEINHRNDDKIKIIPKEHEKNFYHYLTKKDRNKNEVEAVYRLGSHTGSLLYHAVRLGYDEWAIKQIKKGANGFKQLPGTEPVIYAALREGKSRIVSEIIDHANPSDLKSTFNGKTILIQAIQLGKWDVVKKLAQNGASFFSKDNNNFAPLTEMLDHFKYIKDVEEQARLASTFKEIFKDMQKNLTQQSGLVLAKDLLQKNEKNEDDHFYAMLTKVQHITLADIFTETQIKQLPQVIQDQDEAKVKLNLYKQALLAIKQGNAAGLTSLLNDTVNVRRKQEVSLFDDNAPLTMPLEYDKYLHVIERNSFINAVDMNSKNSLLHLAVIKGDPLLVKALVNAHGIMLDVQDANGDTPLQLAIKLKNNDCAYIIKSAQTIDLKTNEPALSIEVNNASEKSKFSVARTVGRGQYQLDEKHHDNQNDYKSVTGNVRTNNTSPLDDVYIEANKVLLILRSAIKFLENYEIPFDDNEMKEVVSRKLSVLKDNEARLVKQLAQTHLDHDMTKLESRILNATFCLTGNKQEAPAKEGHIAIYNAVEMMHLRVSWLIAEQEQLLGKIPKAIVGILTAPIIDKSSWITSTPEKRIHELNEFINKFDPKKNTQLQLKEKLKNMGQSPTEQHLKKFFDELVKFKNDKDADKSNHKINGLTSSTAIASSSLFNQSKLSSNLSPIQIEANKSLFVLKSTIRFIENYDLDSYDSQMKNTVSVTVKALHSSADQLSKQLDQTNSPSNNSQLRKSISDSNDCLLARELEAPEYHGGIAFYTASEMMQKRVAEFIVEQEYLINKVPNEIISLLTGPIQDKSSWFTSTPEKRINELNNFIKDFNPEENTLQELKIKFENIGQHINEQNLSAVFKLIQDKKLTLIPQGPYDEKPNIVDETSKNAARRP